MDKKFEKALMPHLLAAVKYARSRLPLKATNKIYTDKRMVSQMMPKDPKRWSLHTAEADEIRTKNIRALRALKLAPRETANKLEHDYINRIPHAGNCGENAILLPVRQGPAPGQRCQNGSANHEGLPARASRSRLRADRYPASRVLQAVTGKYAGLRPLD